MWHPTKLRYMSPHWIALCVTPSNCIMWCAIELHYVAPQQIALCGAPANCIMWRPIELLCCKGQCAPLTYPIGVIWFAPDPWHKQYLKCLLWTHTGRMRTIWARTDAYPCALLRETWPGCTLQQFTLHALLISSQAQRYLPAFYI